MDGHFVPNLTFGPLIVEALRPVRDEKKTLLDVHLMIEAPDRYLDEFARAGASRLTVHVEACPHLHRTLGRIRELGARAGVALNPATPPGVVDYALDSADLVLVMSVNPGFGGQTFIPTTYPKVKDVRERIGTREIEVEIDGGVKLEHVKRLADHGATILVAGSAIFEAADPAAAVRRMREAALGQ